MNKVKYIGLDISTSIIGICFLDNNYSLIDLQNINLKKIKCIFEKTIYTKNLLEEYKEKYDSEKISYYQLKKHFSPLEKDFLLLKLSLN